jgi:hypothetical protein
MVELGEALDLLHSKSGCRCEHRFLECPGCLSRGLCAQCCDVVHHCVNCNVVMVEV